MRIALLLDADVSADGQYCEWCLEYDAKYPARCVRFGHVFTSCVIKNDLTCRPLRCTACIEAEKAMAEATKQSQPITDGAVATTDRANGIQADMTRLHALLIEPLVARGLWDSIQHTLGEMRDVRRDETDEYRSAERREEEAACRYYDAENRARDERCH